MPYLDKKMAYSANPMDKLIKEDAATWKEEYIVKSEMKMQMARKKIGTANGDSITSAWILRGGILPFFGSIRWTFCCFLKRNENLIEFLGKEPQAKRRPFNTADSVPGTALLAISLEGSNQLTKAICYLKAQNVL
jgi:hypothetical protein